MLYYCLEVITMFFFGIFGIEGKEKEIRDVQNIICKTCSNMTSYKLLKTYNYFHFFFIPLFKWGVQYFLISRCCNTVFSIPMELGKKLEGGGDVYIREEDLTPLNNTFDYGEIVCPSCRSRVESKFRYCPYCGIRIR